MGNHSTWDEDHFDRWTAPSAARAAQPVASSSSSELKLVILASCDQLEQVVKTTCCRFAVVTAIHLLRPHKNTQEHTHRRSPSGRTLRSPVARRPCLGTTPRVFSQDGSRTLELLQFGGGPQRSRRVERKRGRTTGRMRMRMRAWDGGTVGCS